MQNKIIIKGAREHNLKNVNLELPRNQMIVFTGLSGSGKSSLAFDTIFAEGQRRYIESLSAYARQFLGGMQKPDVDEIEGLSPAISIDQKAHSANPRSTVATITEIYDYLRVLFARVGVPHCPDCGSKIEKMTVDEMGARISNFQFPISKVTDEDAKISRRPKGLARNDSKEIVVLSPVVRGRKGEYYQMLYDLYNSGYLEVRVDGKIKSLRERIILEKNFKHTIEVVVDRVPLAVISTTKEKSLSQLPADGDPSSPLKGSLGMTDNQRLAEAVEAAVNLSKGLCAVIYADGEEQTFSTLYSCPKDGFSFPEIEPRLFSFNSPYGYCEACTGLGTKELFSVEDCPVCLGKRLNVNALSVKIGGKNIWEITNLSISEAREFFAALELDLPERTMQICGMVLKEIQNRLQFMYDVGLHYLTLNRKAGTLSGGEAQRIRLASQVGTRLVGALYVLDEPTIGLHQRDNDRLVKTLRALCDAGNTIIVVEHDEDTIKVSDWIVDIGPGAGKHGGEIVYSGTVKDLLSAKHKSSSLTGKYLRGEVTIPMPLKRREVDRATPKLKIKKANLHNLKNINVEIPLRRFVCLTGVSGSGKSTLMNEVLRPAVMNKIFRQKKKLENCLEVSGLEYLDGVITIDQSSIGRTSRSNPATYTKCFDHIRALFAETAEARMRGYTASRFSFNVKNAGRCENCEGKGVLEIEMHFLPSVEVTCDVCKGLRFTNETLAVSYNGKNIAEVLAMTIEDAEEFFRDIPMIYDKLKILNEVGLDYLTLGQSATTLSGGEAQRIKLSRELARYGTTKTLYLLDEPTTGLHYDDVRKLLEVLQRLVSQGNTILVIEHNLDIIKAADWVIDLGPEGGDKGGQVVAVGTPEEVAKKAASFTGAYLKRVI
ncbi:MAG: excinuclease ABC subunit A [Candidatus Magasanikbacteria bacterium RIFOXYC2_FULL_42_28]|uniref:UvrABC system protein A n=1 Tax=Candidatus Magasanikbacteria bacterium RIFOXYC2_FULL_42_28 TaxID=1798704 RepID=A0A1F6NXZ2_9BACT|nr:MAG: excinuclease ABC subunit A [Candidatus Magasanikbacteria bacterium RIFOXYC2_FULL_42_28]